MKNINRIIHNTRCDPIYAIFHSLDINGAMVGLDSHGGRISRGPLAKIRRSPFTWFVSVFFWPGEVPPCKTGYRSDSRPAPEMREARCNCRKPCSN